MILNLGVLDVSYADKKTGKNVTTFDVAQFLEKNYAVMETFFESRKDQIALWLAEDMANSIQDLANGRGINTGSRATSASHKIAGVKREVASEQSGTYTYGADQKIEAAFRQFIFSDEMSKMRGVVSAAAKAGKTKRTKSGYTKGKKARPFAVDSGLFVSAFRAWSSEGAD